MVESASGGLGGVMPGSDSISVTSTSIPSSVPGNQLVLATGEEESASTATSATGKSLNYGKITAHSNAIADMKR